MKTLTRIILLLFIISASACTPGQDETPIPTTQITSPTSLPIPTQIPGEGNADVIFVRADFEDDGTWTFSVTINHPDTSWEDYADGWDVVLADGTVLLQDADSEFTRLLLHPHVDEQPFTRSQNGIIIPKSERYVTVRAHDLAHKALQQVVAFVRELGAANAADSCRSCIGPDLLQTIGHVCQCF